MRTPALANEVPLGLHLQMHSRAKGVMGRFLLTVDGRHNIMQAQKGK